MMDDASVRFVYAEMADDSLEAEARRATREARRPGGSPLAGLLWMLATVWRFCRTRAAGGSREPRSE